MTIYFFISFFIDDVKKNPSDYFSKASFFFFLRFQFLRGSVFVPDVAELELHFVRRAFKRFVDGKNEKPAPRFA